MAGRSIVDQQVNLRLPRPATSRRQPLQHQTSGTRQQKAGHCTATQTTCMCVCRYTIGCNFPSTSICSARRRPGQPCWPPERAPRCGASCCPHAPRPPVPAGACTCNTDRRELSDQSGSRPARRTSMADCAFQRSTCHTRTAAERFSMGIDMMLAACTCRRLRPQARRSPAPGAARLAPAPDCPAHSDAECVISAGCIAPSAMKPDARALISTVTCVISDINLALQPGVADHFVHHLGLRREPSDAAKAYASPMQTQASEDCAAHCRKYANTADAKDEITSVDYIAVGCQG